MAFENATELRPYVQRCLEPILKRDLAQFRAVMLKGPRQSGKSTLATQIASAQNAAYVSLDSPDQRAAAIAEPNRFIGPGSGRLMVVDEVQRAGEDLLLAIKAAVDRDDRRGQFLLTGSANYLMLPKISESLQGRIAISTLFPFSRGEINGSPHGSFIDSAFEDPGSVTALGRTGASSDEYWEAICAGGYPEVQSRGQDFRGGWFNQLVATTISREISELGNIANQDAVAQVLKHCAALSAKELNVQSFVRATGAARQTVSQYLGWLNAAHLVHFVPAWHRSLAKRQIKTQKILVTDSGLACHLVGKDAYALSQHSDVFRGQALETFVGSELLKQIGWSKTGGQLFHWRTVQGSEVDFVFEANDGRVIGIEVKSSTSPGQRSGRGLANLRDEIDRSGGVFVHGFVLHTGDQQFPLGDRLSALPVDALWSTRQERPFSSRPMDLTGADSHADAISTLGKLPEGAAVTLHLRPRHRQEAPEFKHDARELQRSFARIAASSAPTLRFFNVHRHFMSYQVTDIDFNHHEFTHGKLNLDGSATWISPIRTFGVGRTLEQTGANDRITATELVWAVAIGLKALAEWSIAYCEISGPASISVQFHPPRSGVKLGLLAPPIGSISPGVRGVDSDLPPIAIQIDLDDWASDSPAVLLAAKYFSEHLLAAFGYEDILQIDGNGRFDPKGVEKALFDEMSHWAEDMGLA